MHPDFRNLQILQKITVFGLRRVSARHPGAQNRSRGPKTGPGGPKTGPGAQNPVPGAKNRSRGSKSGFRAKIWLKSGFGTYFRPKFRIFDGFSVVFCQLYRLIPLDNKIMPKTRFFRLFCKAIFRLFRGMNSRPGEYYPAIGLD